MTKPKQVIVAEAENAARALLRRHELHTSPVDLTLLCRREGITCVQQNLNDELSGMSFVKNGAKYVVVNASHHINRRRFTLAHEIAHHILHAEYLESHVHVDKAILRRDGLSAEGLDEKEIGANAFAAEALMPRSRMLEFSALDISDEQAVKKAADRFKVSPTAFTYRLMNLGLA